MREIGVPEQLASFWLTVNFIGTLFCVNNQADEISLKFETSV